MFRQELVEARFAYLVSERWTLDGLGALGKKCGLIATGLLIVAFHILPLILIAVLARTIATTEFLAQQSDQLQFLVVAFVLTVGIVLTVAGWVWFTKKVNHLYYFAIEREVVKHDNAMIVGIASRATNAAIESLGVEAQ